MTKKVAPAAAAAAHPLPPLPSLATIADRLPKIFPVGVDARQYMVREMAARTVFVMLYAGAVESTGRWIRPNQVTRMTDDQAQRTSDYDRFDWARRSLAPNWEGSTDEWFADNTREPIRDETLKNGLLTVEAVVYLDGLPTTSSAPRWALAADFAALLTCDEAEFPALLERWREEHLSDDARKRIAMVAKGVVSGAEAVLVELPNGERRRMSPGPSSEIAKQVIEVFAKQYLERPGVVWISESSKKMVAKDEELATTLGLNIDAAKLLPDVILVDVEPRRTRRAPLLVFVEIVASDGPITEARKLQLLKLATEGGTREEDVAFVTALMDRSSAEFKKIAPMVAWGTFIWFASEPDRILVHRLKEKAASRLSELLESW